MPTPKKGKRFGGSPAHQRLILANLPDDDYIGQQEYWKSK